MQSQVIESLGGLKKHLVSSEDLAAIKNRFLELFVHTRPYQEEAHINLNEACDRFHFIVGTFERAIATLKKYSKSDFHSAHLYRYVIRALKKNSLYYEEVMKGTADGDVGNKDGNGNNNNDGAVSYTHLTLPTIYSV